MPVSSKKIIIGRTDHADFPMLGLKDIAIKIDTGAYTSSIHCSDIVEKEGVLHATLLDEMHEQFHGKALTFNDYKVTTVRSSNGEVEQRFKVKANIRIFNKVFKISLTLSNRMKMRYPVLIGRKFLSSKFLVDPELQDVSFLQNSHEN